MSDRSEQPPIAARPAPRSTRASPTAAVELVRKPVNTLAIVPKSARITSLGRKSYNVLLFEAQEQGLEKDVYRAPLDRIIRGIDFDSNDHGLIKKHLRAMVSTTVEWQSPTSGEGQAWNVSGLLAHAKLTKERGQVWVEWSYAVNLKQELLEPTVFARLKLEIVSQLRSHAGIALYEICTRYKEVGRTARQQWRWWHPVLSGQPETERTLKLEYRIFKRDTLKPAIAEVCAITDLDVDLVEHKAGRFVDEIQFVVRPKQQSNLPLSYPPKPIDLSLLQVGARLSIGADKMETLLGEHDVSRVAEALQVLERRLVSNFPEPLKDPYRYLRTLLSSQALPGAEVIKERRGASKSPLSPEAGGKEEALGPRSLPAASAGDSPQGRRQARWTEEWLRRRRERLVSEIKQLSEEHQRQWVTRLLADMEARHVHPSIRKRLQGSGWQHPMALQEMIRFYALSQHGSNWDQPTHEQLLEIAAELGDA